MKNPTTTNIQKIINSQIIIKQMLKETITFSQPIIERENEGIIYPNTINIIQGKSGVHKSRLAENICSSILTRDGMAEFLGFRSNNSRTYSLLYIDTERNIRDQYPYALQKIIENSGYPKTFIPNNFDFISMIDVPRLERFESLKEYLYQYRKTNNDHLVVIIDVITDCMQNFNDAAETMKIIDLLNVMINESDVTFICLIHENPSSQEKARGHLGSELTAKGSTVIQIGFEKDSSNNNTDLIKLKYLKCRSSRRFSPVFLKFSDTLKNLVIAENELIDSTAAARKSKATLNEIKTSLPEILKEKTHKTELIETLCTKFCCSARTIETRLSELINSKSIIMKDMGITYLLDKITENKNVYFVLSKNAN